MKTKLITLGLTCSLLSTSAFGAVIVYEGFNYDVATANPVPPPGGDGSAYSSSTGSVGMRNAWQGSVVAGLTYGDLVTSANGLTATTNNAFQSTVYRNMADDPFTSLRVGGSNTGNFGADGTTLYYSFLMQAPEVGTGKRALLQLTGNSGGNRIFLGIWPDATTFSIGNANGGTANTSVTAAANTTYLLVARIDFASGNDTVNLWVNPTLNGIEPATADATMTNYDLVGGFQQLAFRYDGNSTMLFDEFRMGETFADVTPVPEPSTYALLGGLAALGLVYLRRRKGIAK